MYALNQACSGNSLPLRAVEEAFARLVAADEDLVLALHFALATIAANRDQESDPTWGMLVGASSSAKTEIIGNCSSCTSVEMLSDITTKAFASGARGQGGENMSLLHRLPGKVLAIKDFTTLVSMKHEHRSEVMAQLREIYDGRFDKSFGTGDKVKWTGRVGLIAACTQAIDGYHAVIGALGERFIYYRLRPSDRQAAAHKALEMTGTSSQAREVLRELIAKLIDHLDPSQIERQPTQDVSAFLAALADLAARVRTHVERDQHHRLIQAFEHEGPGRLIKQLWNLARGHAAIRGADRVGRGDLALVRRVAADSVSPTRWAVFSEIASRADIAAEDLSSPAVQKIGRTTRVRLVEDLEHLGLVEKYERKIKTDSGGEESRQFVRLTKTAAELWAHGFGGEIPEQACGMQ